MTARPTRPVPLVRVFRHSHLMLSNPEPTRLVNLVPDFAQELEDSAVHQEISRFHNRLALVNFYDGYRAAQAKPDEFLREAGRIYPRNQNRPRDHTSFSELQEWLVMIFFWDRSHTSHDFSLLSIRSRHREVSMAVSLGRYGPLGCRLRYVTGSQSPVHLLMDRRGKHP